MKNYQPTIGLEIHTELKTASKMFCGCKNDPFCHPPAGGPNTHTCPVCLGLPGAMPVFNKQAIELTMMIGLAVGGKITDFSQWDRKNYFYPDLPKGFQISQYDLPLVRGGELNGVKLTRIHLEEDTGKLFHPKGTDYSLIDYNRSGVPLVELVTEPVITSGGQAVAFAKEWQLLLRYLGAADADMEKGMMRIEANISLSQNSKQKTQNLGTKVEIKNLNSFRSVGRAIEYEIKRQTEILENNGQIIQETRGWDENRQKTFAMRTKETSADYRYFPEPDLPPIERSTLNAQGSRRPELPWKKRERYRKEYNLSDNVIETIVGNLGRVKVFEELAKKYPEKIAKIAAIAANVRESELAEVDKKLAAGIAEELNEDETAKIIKQVIADNQNIVAKIKAGKTSAIQALVGRAIKLSQRTLSVQGKINPQTAAKLFKKQIL